MPSAVVRVAAVVMLVVMAALGTGCRTASEDQVGEAGEGTTSSSALDRSVRLPTVSLGVTDWTAAKLNVAIAEQLIERRLAQPVEVVRITDTRRMLDDLATGELDAVLEVWPSSLGAAETGRLGTEVDSLGPLGVVGKVGWFVPRYVLVDDPALATWEGFAAPGVAGRFAGPGSGSAGRFLGTDPAYDQRDEELIDALGLPFTVVWSGSEQATRTEVERAVARRDPVLLYWWTPTAELRRYDLVEVGLPPRTDECLAAIEAGGPLGCDYPSQELLKLGSPSLAADSPAVHAFLRAFSLTTEDQLRLLDQVENGGSSVEDAAAAWVAVNRDRWERWFDADS